MVVLFLMLGRGDMGGLGWVRKGWVGWGGGGGGGVYKGWGRVVVKDGRRRGRRRDVELKER